MIKRFYEPSSPHALNLPACYAFIRKYDGLLSIGLGLIEPRQEEDFVGAGHQKPVRREQAFWAGFDLPC